MTSSDLDPHGPRNDAHGHDHVHTHPDGTTHSHPHAHDGEHRHAHDGVEPPPAPAQQGDGQESGTARPNDPADGVR